MGETFPQKSIQSPFKFRQTGGFFETGRDRIHQPPGGPGEKGEKQFRPTFPQLIPGKLGKTGLFPGRQSLDDCGHTIRLHGENPLQNGPNFWRQPGHNGKFRPSQSQFRHLTHLALGNLLRCCIHQLKSLFRKLLQLRRGFGLLEFLQGIHHPLRTDGLLQFLQPAGLGIRGPTPSIELDPFFSPG